MLNTSYCGEKALALRAENIPCIDWDMYNTMRDCMRKRNDICTFRQGQQFRVSVPLTYYPQVLCIGE